MRRLFFTGISAATYCVLLSLAGCSNLLEPKSNGINSNTEHSISQRGSFEIKLGSGARYIQAAEYDLASIDEWTVDFYEYSKESGEYASSACCSLSWRAGDSVVSNGPSLAYNGNDKTLAAANLQVGIYKINVQGSYPGSTNNKIIVAGTARDVDIAQGKNNPVTVLVGLKKSPDGTGNISLTLSGGGMDVDFSDLSSYLSVTLENISDSAISYVYNAPSTNADLSSNTLEGTPGDNLLIAGTDIISGWYRISLKIKGSWNNTKRYVYVPSDKVMIEVADGVTTAAEVLVHGSETKTYYAANSAASGNGLSALSRRNLNSLLSAIADNPPEDRYICIYMDEEPEIDIDSVIKLKESLDSEYSIDIYTEETRIVSVRNSFIASFEPYTLIFKNGAVLNDETFSFHESGNTKIGICVIAEDADGNIIDNFEAYAETPFITASSDISGSAVLYDKDKNEADYKVVTAQTGQAYKHTIAEKTYIANLS